MHQFVSRKTPLTGNRSYAQLQLRCVVCFQCSYWDSIKVGNYEGFLFSPMFINAVQVCKSLHSHICTNRQSNTKVPVDQPARRFFLRIIFRRFIKCVLSYASFVFLILLKSVIFYPCVGWTNYILCAAKTGGNFKLHSLCKPQCTSLSAPCNREVLGWSKFIVVNFFYINCKS